MLFWKERSTPFGGESFESNKHECNLCDIKTTNKFSFMPSSSSSSSLLDSLAFLVFNFSKIYTFHCTIYECYQSVHTCDYSRKIVSFFLSIFKLFKAFRQANMAYYKCTMNEQKLSFWKILKKCRCYYIVDELVLT